MDGTTVTIERLDEHTHTRDIEESFRIKKPSILLGYIKSEAAKSCSAAEIYHAFRAGSERLGELGDSSLKRQDIVNLRRGMGSADLRAPASYPVRGLPHGKLFQDDVFHAL